MKITVDETKPLQTVYGWGTSSCWWSQNVSDEKTRNEIADCLYSDNGLHLNIYRYNVGGGYDENTERVKNPWRLTESFYVKDEQTGEWVYDFTRDKNAVDMMKKCVATGNVDTVILFANSPHYTFTVSGQSSGGLSENQSNLRKDCYQKYVDYFLTVTEHFLDEGIPVKFISPINEPQWKWGGSVRQEGCHYEPDEVLLLMQLFAKGIKERGLDVKLYAPESGSITDHTKQYFGDLTSDSDINDTLGALCYHCYWADDKALVKKDFGKFINKNYPSYRVDMSEWCELPCKNDTASIESALIMARVISQDMSLSHASSWTSWVAVNQIGLTDGLNYSDGLLSATDDFSQYSISMRYYALAHYSKYIPVNSVMLESSTNVSTLHLSKAEGDDGKASDSSRYISTYDVNFSAYKTPDGKTVIVIVNEGGDREIKLGAAAEKMTVITTDSEKQLAETYSGTFSEKLTIGKNSITTVICE